MSGPRVAVVIPAYNAATWLGATLASVAAQTRPADEVIVVDDGSTDATAEVARRAGVRVLTQANAGPGAARNRGIAATDCELIAFLDADDLFQPEKLARQVAALAAAPAEVVAVCCDASVLGGVRDGQRKSGGPLPPRFVLADLLTRNPVIASSVLTRRAAVLGAGGFDEDRDLIATEDYDLWLRMLAVPGAAFLYLDEPLLRYRVSGSSLSSGERFLRGVDKILTRVAARCPGDAEVARAVAGRRTRARVDAAWESLERGDRPRARVLLREARQLGGWSWPIVKLLLRSLLPAPGR